MHIKIKRQRDRGRGRTGRTATRNGYIHIMGTIWDMSVWQWKHSTAHLKWQCSFGIRFLDLHFTQFISLHEDRQHNIISIPCWLAGWLAGVRLNGCWEVSSRKHISQANVLVCVVCTHFKHNLRLRHDVWQRALSAHPESWYSSAQSARKVSR